MLKFKTFILKVNEGLIKTQPLYKSIEIIKRNNIEPDLDNNKFSIEFDGILNINQTEGFMKIVNNLGYYCSAYFLVKIGEKLFIWKDIEIDISDNYYNDIKIYYDPNMIGGYYTYQNIKPKNIKQLIQ